MKRSIALVLVAFAAACEKKAATPDTTAVTPPPTPAPAAAPAAPTGPTAIIVKPAEGDSTGPDVQVVLSAKNVTIAKADSKRVEGTGHFHLYLDTIPSMDTMPIPPTTKQIVHIGTGDSTYTFKGLTPGQHQIIAVIGYGNHVPMAGTTDTVHFVVKK